MNKIEKCDLCKKERSNVLKLNKTSICEYCYYDIEENRKTN